MRSRGASLAALLAAAACCALAAAPGGEGDGSAAPPQRREPTMHTVFSAECTPYFDWQSIALVRSHKLVGMPGPITRLLACDQDRLQSYKYVDVVPTHVHPNFDKLHWADIGDNYVPYNKPGSIKHWLENTNVTEDYVFFIDADMLFLRPVTPTLVGASPGHGVSAAYDYLVGVDNPAVVERFLAEEHRHLMRKVGGWTMMQVADMRRVAPLWLSYTEAVRTAKFGREVWHLMGDAYVTEEHPRPWISEMYGYVFGSAAAGVDHTVNREMMLYPTYVPDAEPPYILHYGLEILIGDDYKFDKHFHTSADRLSCPVKLFDPPPDVSAVLAKKYPAGQGQPLREKERLELAAFTITSLNSALSEFGGGIGHCPVCPPGCKDDADACAGWATAGECEKNPGFMQSNCKLTCGTCKCAPAGDGGAAPKEVLLRGGAVAKRDGGREAGGEAPKAEAPPPPRRVSAALHAANAVRDAHAQAAPEGRKLGEREQGGKAEEEGEEEEESASPPPPPPKARKRGRKTGGGEEALVAKTRPRRVGRRKAPVAVRGQSKRSKAADDAPYALATSSSTDDSSAEGLPAPLRALVGGAALGAVAVLAARAWRRRLRAGRRRRTGSALVSSSGAAPAGSRYDD